MPLEINRERFAMVMKHPAARRASLFGVKVVGYGHIHDALGPVGPGVGRPVGALVDARDAARKPPPQTTGGKKRYHGRPRLSTAARTRRATIVASVLNALRRFKPLTLVSTMFNPSCPRWRTANIVAPSAGSPNT